SIFGPALAPGLSFGLDLTRVLTQESLMKFLFAILAVLAASAAAAQTSINLPTPQTIALAPVVQTFGCYAESVNVRPYSTAVTGFSADGNYVTGQAPAYFNCGHRGGCSTTHTSVR